MRKFLNSSQWRIEATQEGKDVIMEFPRLETEKAAGEAPDGHWIDIQFRSSDGVDVSLITEDGELIYLMSGQVCEYQGEVIGFRGLSVACDSTFAYVGSFTRSGSTEVVDPVPAAVTLELDQDDTLTDAIAPYLDQFVERMRRGGFLKDDVSEEDIMEDLLEGDYEFDDEEDMAFQTEPVVLATTELEDTFDPRPEDPQPLPVTTPPKPLDNSETDPSEVTP